MSKLKFIASKTDADKNLIEQVTLSTKKSEKSEKIFIVFSHDLKM